MRKDFLQAERTLWTDDELEQWLVETRFEKTERGWLCEDITLDALDRSEYRIIEEL